MNFISKCLMIVSLIVSLNSCNSRKLHSRNINELVEKIKAAISSKNPNDFDKISINYSSVSSTGLSFIYCVHGSNFERYEYFSCAEAKKNWPELINRLDFSSVEDTDYIVKLYWSSPAPIGKLKMTQEFIVKKYDDNYLVFSLKIQRDKFRLSSISDNNPSPLAAPASLVICGIPRPV